MEHGGEPIVDVSAPRAQTRWDDRTTTPAPRVRRERSGVYLAIVIAASLPVLIALAAVRSMAGGGPTSASNEQRVDLEPPPLEPATEVFGDSVAIAPATTEEINGIDSEVAPTGTEPVLSESTTIPTTGGSPDLSSTAPTVTAPASASPTLPRPVADGSARPSVPTSISPATGPSTTAAPATTQAGSSTTATTTTTTSTTVVVDDPPDFVERLDIGALGDTFVRYRFAINRTVSYATLLLRDGAIQSQASGTAQAGEQVRASFDDLEPGTDYGVQVVIEGSPVTSSAVVPFRTSGEPAVPATVPVEILNLRVVGVEETRIELR